MNATGALLTTDSGTALYATVFALQAQNDLYPLISSMSPNTQAQITVDYMRAGPDTFWNYVMQRRGMSPQDLQMWKLAPSTSPYLPLAPNPDNFVQQQFDQLGRVMTP